MYYIIILIIVILDQISKYFVVKLVQPVFTIPIIQNVFHLTYAENTGAAFSILSNRLPVLTIMNGIFIIFLVFYQYRMIRSKGSPMFIMSLSFIIGGALGNMLDRLRLGYVVDFFDFRLINFAIFNVADSFIVIGAILLMIMILIEEKGKNEKIHD